MDHPAPSKARAAPQLLEQLVRLTAIRDAELLEFTLLRTLHDMLSLDELALFKLAPNGVPVFHMSCLSDGVPRVNTGDATIAEDVLIGARHAEATRLIWRGEREDGVRVAVYPVLEMRGYNTCLMLATRHDSAPEEDRLIQGFLKFYSNYCDLLDYSQRDQLTGLMNRKTFDESVFKLFTQSARQADATPPSAGADERRRPLTVGEFWLGMSDIDHFKRVNDTYGHLYGDEVLLLAAQLMQRCFRDSDLLFRFGGEEFVIILQHSDREGARVGLERLRKAMANHVFPQVGQVTVSIGAVQMSPGSLTPILLDAADKALYYCKQHGRNQVAIFEDLLERGLVERRHEVQGSIDLF